MLLEPLVADAALQLIVLLRAQDKAERGKLRKLTIDQIDG